MSGFINTPYVCTQHLARPQALNFVLLAAKKAAPAFYVSVLGRSIVHSLGAIISVVAMAKEEELSL